MWRNGLRAGGIGLALAGAALAQAEALRVDVGLPGYQRAAGVVGNLNSVGSDTLNNLMTFWAEGFARLYPNIKVQVEGKGSSTAPPALIAGAAQLGPMSRAMKASEMDAFEKKYGYKPTAIAVALDALSVYVNKDNPISSLSLEQVDAIFSSTRACGAKDAITTWAQLGLAWTAPMSLYGRNSASGTYGYFKEHALCKGDFRDSVKEQPGSATVVEGVTNDRFAIGYSGMGYLTAGVRAVPLIPLGGAQPRHWATASGRGPHGSAVSLGGRDVAPIGDVGEGATGSARGAPPYEATPDNVYAGIYPLSRYLYIYINKAPGKGPDPLVKQFLLYVLSQEGQAVVIKDGFIPLVNEIADVERKKLE